MNKLVVPIITVLALALVGCSPGDSSSPSPEPETSTSSVSAPVSPVVSEDSSPSSFSNYIGQSYDEVFAELKGYGIRISKTEEESTKPPGTIIAQSPEGGADFDTNIELVVAILPAGVPDVLEYSFGQAKGILEDLGFSVVEKSVIDESKSDGAIISQDPAPGTENYGKVTLTVARQPVSYGLSDIKYLVPKDYVSYRFELEGTFESNGKSYSRGASLRFQDTGTAVLSFNLSRDFLNMDGDIGLSDDSPKGAKAKVDVIGDDRELFTGTVGFGETLPFKADVSDVLRLEVRVAPTDSEAVIVLGDWRVLGFEDSVDKDELEEEEEEEE